MRTLKPTKSDKDLTNKEVEKLQEQIDDLRNTLAELGTEVDAEEQELDDYKADNRSSITTGSFAADTGNIGILATDTITATTKITAPIVEATNKIETDRLEADTAVIDEGTINNLTATQGRVIGNLKVDGGIEVDGNLVINGEYNIENETIENATIDTATISEAEIGTIKSNTITADKATITEIHNTELTSELIEAGVLRSTETETESLEVSDRIDNNLEVYTGEPIINTDSVWITLPIIQTGSVKLHAVDENNVFIFGLYITYAGSDNATIQYKEREWNEQPTCLDNDVYLFDNKLYFHCMKLFSKIYWKVETSDVETNASPATQYNCPIDIAQAEHFLLKNKTGTIFTRYVQIGENGEGVLTLSPTSWLESADESVQYDPSQNVNFGFYAPDQDLDKGSSPEFHSIKLDTEGKTVVRATEEGVVYTQEEASVDNGTLIPEPKLIEADDLYEYNGNSYDIVTRTTPGDWIILPSEVNPMKAETTAEDVNGYFWHYENEGGWSEITSNKLFEHSEYRQGFAWPINNSTGLLGFDLSGYTLDGTEEIPGYGDYKLHTGDRFAIKICSDVWNSNSCTRTYKLDPTVRGNAISETYTGDWFAHSTSKNYLMKNIYASGDSRNAVSTFTNEGSETGLNLNFTNAFSLVNSFYNKLAGTSNLNNFCIIKQGNNYFITKSRSASWSFTQKVVSCFNGVYTSLNAAINAFFNQTYSGTQSVTLTSNVDWFYPMLLGEDCNVGSGQVCTPLTAYRYKKIVQSNIKRFVDDTDTPLDSHFANTSVNNNYYIQRNDGKWAQIASINTSYTTVVTIGEPYGIKANTIAGTPTTVYYTLTYDSNGIFIFGTYDPNVITPPATLNKLYEVIKVPKGDVEYSAVTETTIDYTSTGHPITNLGDNTVVYGRATVGTNLTVNRDTVLGNDEGTIDPDTGDPIHTNTEVKGDLTAKKNVTVGTTASDSFTAKSIAYFENGLEVGSVSEPRHAHHYGDIYRYNFDTNTDEEINSTYQRVDEKGIANGYAPLDENARIPRNYMPYDVMEYRGSWDASSGVFPQGTAQDPLQVGDTYKVSVAGTINGQYYGIGDEITYNGSTWDYYENNKVILGTTDLGVVGCMWLG